MNTKIICTLGPSSYSKKILNNFKKEGVDIFRVNLSHTSKKDIEKKIIFLKKNRIKNICLDTEGAQIRISVLKKKIFLKKNKIIKIFCGDKKTSANKIFLSPQFDLDKIKKNTLIFIGFESLVIKIVKKHKFEDFLYGKVIKSGFLESRKGVHIDQSIKLQPLSKKDYFALNLALKYKLNYFAISFVNNHKDILQVKQIIGKNKIIISKIETLNAIKDLKKISKESNALLIDRGDLSRYIPIEKIPIAQNKILEQSKIFGIPVYIATNLLETMINTNLPTRAESNDIHSCLDKGAKGLVLAAETAIGKHPVECVKFLNRCIGAFKNRTKF